MFYFCEYFIFGRIKSNNTHTSKINYFKNNVRWRKKFCFWKLRRMTQKSFIYKNNVGWCKNVLFIKIPFDVVPSFYGNAFQWRIIHPTDPFTINGLEVKHDFFLTKKRRLEKGHLICWFVTLIYICRTFANVFCNCTSCKSI
jgi:hypothetical protein